MRPIGHAEHFGGEFIEPFRPDQGLSRQACRGVLAFLERGVVGTYLGIEGQLRHHRASSPPCSRQTSSNLALAGLSIPHRTRAADHGAAGGPRYHWSVACNGELAEDDGFNNSSAVSSGGLSDRCWRRNTPHLGLVVAIASPKLRCSFYRHVRRPTSFWSRWCLTTRCSCSIESTDPWAGLCLRNLMVEAGVVCAQVRGSARESDDSRRACVRSRRLSPDISVEAVSWRISHTRHSSATGDQLSARHRADPTIDPLEELLES